MKETFATEVQQEFERVVNELPRSTASISEDSDPGVMRLRIEPNFTSLSPLEILIEDGAGCTVFIGTHGRFEHLKPDPVLIFGFVHAALEGKVSETVFEWNGKRIQAVTRVQIGDIPYTHNWTSAFWLIAKLLLWPWIRRREIKYKPYLM